MNHVSNTEGQVMAIEYFVGGMVSKTPSFDGSVVSNGYAEWRY
ncbi:hypothetical protein [Pontiella sulfatireligans]|nr:hypothetical protein [Pontiella sulfatireligans]